MSRSASIIKSSRPPQQRHRRFRQLAEVRQIRRSAEAKPQHFQVAVHQRYRNDLRAQQFKCSTHYMQCHARHGAQRRLVAEHIRRTPAAARQMFPRCRTPAAPCSLADVERANIVEAHDVIGVPVRQQNRVQPIHSRAQRLLAKIGSRVDHHVLSAARKQQGRAQSLVVRVARAAHPAMASRRRHAHGGAGAQHRKFYRFIFRIDGRFTGHGEERNAAQMPAHVGYAAGAKYCKVLCGANAAAQQTTPAHLALRARLSPAAPLSPPAPPAPGSLPENVIFNLPSRSISNASSSGARLPLVFSCSVSSMSISSRAASGSITGCPVRGSAYAPSTIAALLPIMRIKFSNAGDAFGASAAGCAAPPSATRHGRRLARRFDLRFAFCFALFRFHYIFANFSLSRERPPVDYAKRFFSACFQTMVILKLI